MGTKISDSLRVDGELICFFFLPLFPVLSSVFLASLDRPLLVWLVRTLALLLPLALAMATPSFSVAFFNVVLASFDRPRTLVPLPPAFTLALVANVFACSLFFWTLSIFIFLSIVYVCGVIV